MRFALRALFFAFLTYLYTMFTCITQSLIDDTQSLKVACSPVLVYVKRGVNQFQFRSSIVIFCC